MFFFYYVEEFLFRLNMEKNHWKIKIDSKFIYFGKTIPKLTYLFTFILTLNWKWKHYFPRNGTLIKQKCQKIINHFFCWYDSKLYFNILLRLTINQIFNCHFVDIQIVRFSSFQLYCFVFFYKNLKLYSCGIRKNLPTNDIKYRLLNECMAILSINFLVEHFRFARINENNR